MKKRVLAALRTWILPVLTVAFLLFVFSNSAQSAQRSSDRSAPVANWLSGTLEGLFHTPVSPRFCSNLIRKAAHVGEYAVLSALLSLSVALRRKSLRSARSEIWLCALFAGLTDEYIQTLPAGRSPQVNDVMIDFAGALIGYALIALIFRLRERKKAGPS